MPLFTYECSKCSIAFEKLISSHTDPNPVCEQCEGPTNRCFGKTSFILKGHGWARDGYSNKPPGSETNSGTVVRRPEYKDRITGKSLGLGAPEIMSLNE